MSELPEILSLEKFREIAHISKRKARYLLLNAIIPCIDTGKTTHRFQIKREDVHEYLENQRKYDRQIPIGIFGKKGKLRTKVIKPIDKALFSEFLEGKWKSRPDALYLVDCSQLMGYDKETLLRWCQKGDLESINYYGKLLIAKSNLIDLVVIKVNTEPKTTAILSSLAKEYKRKFSVI